jgi:hypothetical protein
MTHHPRGHVIPIPAVAGFNDRKALGERSKLLSGLIFLWSKLLTSEFYLWWFFEQNCIQARPAGVAPDRYPCSPFFKRPWHLSGPTLAP